MLSCYLCLQYLFIFLTSTEIVFKACSTTRIVGQNVNIDDFDIDESKGKEGDKSEIISGGDSSSPGNAMQSRDAPQPSQLNNALHRCSKLKDAHNSLCSDSKLAHLSSSCSVGIGSGPDLNLVNPEWMWK